MNIDTGAIVWQNEITQLNLDNARLVAEAGRRDEAWTRTAGAWCGFAGHPRPCAHRAVGRKRQIFHQRDYSRQNQRLLMPLILKEKTRQAARFSTKRTNTPGCAHCSHRS